MITVSLPEEVEAWLDDIACKSGLPAEQYLRKLIIDHLPKPPVVTAEITAEELFAQWAAEDPVIDAADLAQRIEEAEELFAALNTNRRDCEGLGARLPCPSIAPI